jgi:hypothetical protein
MNTNRWLKRSLTLMTVVFVLISAGCSLFETEEERFARELREQMEKDINELEKSGYLNMDNGFTIMDSQLAGVDFEYFPDGVVEVPSAVTKIDHSAFAESKELKSIVIPDSVTELDYGAFYGCVNLESVVIGNGITEIPYTAFYLCTSLKSIVIPNSVKSVADDSAFAFCYSLSDDAKRRVRDLDGYLPDEAGNILHDGLSLQWLIDGFSNSKQWLAGNADASDEAAILDIPVQVDSNSGYDCFTYKDISIYYYSSTGYVVEITSKEPSKFEIDGIVLNKTLNETKEAFANLPYEEYGNIYSQEELDESGFELHYRGPRHSISLYFADPNSQASEIVVEHGLLG